MSVLSDWLGRPWERAPPSIYFSEAKLQAWSNLTDFLEDTLKSVRKQLSPLFKDLKKNISGRMIGKKSLLLLWQINYEACYTSRVNASLGMHKWIKVHW